MRIAVSIGSGLGNMLMTTPLLNGLTKAGHDVIILARPTDSKFEFSGVFECFGEVWNYKEPIVFDRRIGKIDISFINYWWHYGNLNIPCIGAELETYLQDVRLPGSEWMSNCRWALDAGLVDKKDLKPICSFIGLEFEEEYITVCIGGKKLDRIYDNFYNFIKSYGGMVYIVGSEEDVVKEEEKILLLPNVKDFRGIGILTTAGIIHSSKAFVSSACGLIWLAVCVGTPTIVLWGIDDPVKNGYPLMFNYVSMCNRVPCIYNKRYEICKHKKCLKEPDYNVLVKMVESIVLEARNVGI